MKNSVSNMLKSVGSHFWKFFKRLYVFVFFFGMPYGICFGVSLIIPLTLRSWGLSYDTTDIISKIMLTITPIIPTAMFTRYEKEDLYEEFSMDLCFVSWILTIIYAWKLL